MNTVPIPAAAPRVTAFALDCADAQARGRAWTADFDAEPGTPVEEAGLLVLALAHGAAGASARGRALGTAAGLLPGAEEEAGAVEEQTGSSRGAVPKILLVSGAPASSEAIRRWHATCWEAGYPLGVHEAGAAGEPGGLSATEASPRILITDDPIEDEARILAAEGVHVLLDSCPQEAERRFADPGLLVERISRGGRGLTAPSGQPGPLLTRIAPALARAMERLADPPPAPRALRSAPSDLADSREGEEVIAAHPGGGAAITREPIGAGALWRVGSVLDSATRRGLLGLIGAYARLRPSILDLPDGIEAAERGGLLLLINHADRAREIAGVFGTDLVSGSLCTGHVVLGRAGAMAIARS